MSIAKYKLIQQFKKTIPNLSLMHDDFLHFKEIEFEKHKDFLLQVRSISIKSNQIKEKHKFIMEEIYHLCRMIYLEAKKWISVNKLDKRCYLCADQLRLSNIDFSAVKQLSNPIPNLFMLIVLFDYRLFNWREEEIVNSLVPFINFQSSCTASFKSFIQFLSILYEPFSLFPYVPLRIALEMIVLFNVCTFIQDECRERWESIIIDQMKFSVDLSNNTYEKTFTDMRANLHKQKEDDSLDLAFVIGQEPSTILRKNIQKQKRAYIKRSLKWKKRKEDSKYAPLIQAAEEKAARQQEMLLE